MISYLGTDCVVNFFFLKVKRSHKQSIQEYEFANRWKVSMFWSNKVTI